MKPESFGWLRWVGCLILVECFLIPSTVLGKDDAASTTYHPRHVEVKGEPGRFELQVDGTPYFIRGVGFNVDRLEYGEKEMQLAKETGFNSLRTWGAGSTTLKGLDLAEKHGLSVIPAWWLSQDKKENPTGRDYSNEKQNQEEVSHILEFVNEFKQHPAVLMWGIGNEVYLFGGQGADYCKFVEQVCQAIHKEDPHHPVLCVDVNTAPIADLAKYTPSLDVYGINTYGSWTMACSTQQDAVKALKKPVLFSEFGPTLPGGDSKVNPKLHAQTYVEIWKRAILPLAGTNIGGYFFVFRDGRPDDTYYGIFDCQNRPKPVVYQAIRNSLFSSALGDEVKVVRSEWGYDLKLNDRPYFVRGVPAGPEDLTKQHLEEMSRIGLNTLLLGTNACEKPEFGFLSAFGLKAMVRIPLAPEYQGNRPTGRDYSNSEQNKLALTEVLTVVEKYKKEPAVLMWEVGEKTYQHCVHKEEFARFLNELAKAIHGVDSRHPVFHTTGYDAGFRNFAKFTPDLDLVGVETEAGPGVMNSMAENADRWMRRPVLFVSNSFLDEGAGRSKLTEEVKTWCDVELWKRGVLRSRPFTIGGCFRRWRDQEGDLWGFVRKDGTPKTANLDEVRNTLLADDN